MASHTRASDGPVFRSSRVIQWSTLSDVEREQFTRFVAENNVSVRKQQALTNPSFFFYSPRV